jgi:hypothetical protein
MAEHTNISNSVACAQWETLLADALDGQLKPGDEAVFTAHMAVCPACTALFDDARLGREWLGFLSTEPEVPAGLLDKILAKTGPGQLEDYYLAPAGARALPVAPAILAWQRPGFVGNVRRFAEPRLLMTAAMAFFSISITLSLTNVRLSSFRLADLRPAAVRSLMERRLTMASTPIVRYYDHSHFVYEVESTVRELRRATQGEGQGVSEGGEDRQKPRDTAPGESKQNPGHKDVGSPIETPQQSANPALDDFSNSFETSQMIQARPTLSGGSATALRERSTSWIA